MARKMVHSHVRPPSPPTSLPFCVRTAGRMYDQPYHSTRGTYSGDAMLTVCVGGRGTYHVGERVLPIEAGMVGLVLPDPSVGVMMADPDAPYDHYYCRFAGHFALGLARQIVAAAGTAFFPYSHLADLTDTLDRLAQADRPDLDRGDVFLPVDAMLAEILAEILARLSGSPTPTATGPTAQHLLDYMHAHLAEPADLAQMAEHFGLCKSHLCRLARPLLGDTIHRVWQEMKMRWAWSLLEQSPLAVADVAHRVGFRDPFYFSRVFRRHTGLTPRQVRKHQSEHE